MSQFMVFVRGSRSNRSIAPQIEAARWARRLDLRARGLIGAGYRRAILADPEIDIDAALGKGAVTDTRTVFPKVTAADELD